ncbi:hypothetical protein MOE86_15485 [Bacillus atrophaeus]|uniref:hypothetical protein n=1 Tax=Bacillus atrophaeus TaxID=1452 RepID=UPI00227F99B1|nr:hypothetical protein [Bacillus atrophaeus]MCY9198080.1 hypothetical protein [Bacillus atrophaeus]
MEAAVTVAAESYEYDVFGRMKYHPDFILIMAKSFQSLIWSIFASITNQMTLNRLLLR